MFLVWQSGSQDVQHFCDQLVSLLRKLKKPTTHEFTRVVAGLVCPHGTDQCRLGGMRPQPPPSRHGRRGGAATPEPTRGRFDAGRSCADAHERANSGRAALTHMDVLTRTGCGNMEGC